MKIWYGFKMSLAGNKNDKKMQAPGLRIPPAKGCRPFGRPELYPAHACTIRLCIYYLNVKLFTGSLAKTPPLGAPWRRPGPFSR